MSKITLTLIIPAYNEEKKIAKDIKAAYKHFKKAKIAAEVIVSCNNCIDNTEKIVKELQKVYKNLILLSTNKKIGKGGAIKRGVAKARGKYVMFADSGLCVPFKFVDDGIKALDKGADLALASRALPGSVLKRKQPFYRFIGSRVFGLIFRHIMHSPREIPDTQCGFKFYKKNVARVLYKELELGGFMFDLELLLRAKKKGFNIAQFPVSWSNDDDTRFHPIRGGIDDVKQLWRIKVKMGL